MKRHTEHVHENKHKLKYDLYCFEILYKDSLDRHKDTVHEKQDNFKCGKCIYSIGGTV